MKKPDVQAEEQNPRHTTNFDVQLGSRIRAARVVAGMSQSELGAALGVTFQQVQKYEKGFNRVPGERLVKIADTLSVSVTSLMGMEDNRPGWTDMHVATFLGTYGKQGTALIERLAAMKRTKGLAVIELALAATK